MSTTLAVSFGPAAAPAVSGYTIDSGQTYGARSGRTFGWSVNHTDVVLDRNKNTNQLLDTHVAVKAGGKWELAVPNGTYTVKVGVGDSGAASKNNVWIEGVQLYNYQALNANAFSSKSLSVKVSDGRLTMAIGSAASGTTRVNFIQVAGLPNVPPTTPPVVPPTTPPVSPPATPPVSPSPVAGQTLKVNFQPAAAPAVSGYLIDSGQTYGARNGRSYGWSVNHADAVLDRNKNANQLLDTRVAVKAGGKWELAVPNGRYTVTVGVGDSAAASKNNVWIEGVQLFNYQSLNANAFSSKSISVNVTDGKLTLGVGSAAGGTTRIDFIEVAGLTTSPPPTSPPVSPPVTPGGSTTLFSKHDTFTRGGTYGATKFGSSTQLEVGSGMYGEQNRAAWLMFNVPSSISIGRATLRVFARLNSDGLPTLASVHTASSTNWSETGLTYFNAPQVDTTSLGEFNVTSTTGRWFDVDVTAALKAQQWSDKTSISVIIGAATNGQPYMMVGSKESSTKPQLIIEGVAPPTVVISDLTPVVASGGTKDVGIRLSAAPAAATAVTITREINGDADLGLAGGVTSATLVFTPENWNTPQSITIAAATNAGLVAGAATFSVTAPGLNARTIVAVEASTAAPGGSFAVLAPVADAYARSGSFASLTDGFSSDLPVRTSASGNGNLRSFLSFDLSAVDSISSAKLRLAGRLQSVTAGSMTVGLYAADGTDWTQTSLNWNKKPSANGVALATETLSSATNAMYEWDITEHLIAAKAAGKTIVSFALAGIGNSDNVALFRSSEAAGAWRPEIVINAPLDLQPLKVMAIGDSITRGNAGGYREPLHNLLSAANPGRTIEFVGTQTGYGTTGLASPAHEGRGGYMIDGIAGNLDADAQTVRNDGGYWLTGGGIRPSIWPDVILLHIGTNDMPSSLSVEELRDKLDALINQLTTLRPNAHLFVSDLIVRNDAKESKSAAYGALLPALVSKYADMGRHVSFVSMHDKLTVSDLGDSLHTNETGNHKMGDTWFKAMQQVLAKPV